MHIKKCSQKSDYIELEKRVSSKISKVDYYCLSLFSFN